MSAEPQGVLRFEKQRKDLLNLFRGQRRLVRRELHKIV
jgi:hypothetical protein